MSKERIKHQENPMQAISRLSMSHALLQIARRKMNEDKPTDAQEKQLAAAELRFRKHMHAVSTRPAVLVSLHRYISDFSDRFPDRAEVFVTDIDTAMEKIARKNKNGTGP